VQGAGHIPGGEEVRVGGPQPGVNHDPVADLQARRLGQLGVRRDPDADDDGVGRDVAAVGQPDAAGPAVRGGDLAHLNAEPQVHAVLAVQAGEDAGNLGAEDPQQRQLGRLQQGDLDAGRAGRGGALQPDPPRADDRDPGDGLEGGLDLVTVAHPAQVEHAICVGARHPEAARRGPGGQQQPGVADPAVVGQGHLVRRAVDAGYGDAEAQLDAVIGVPRRRVDVDRVAFGLAQQVVLGQGRALVRPFGLIPDQHDWAVEPFLAQGLRGLGPGQPCPGDHVCAAPAHFPLSCLVGLALL
jgi:hypothetical protein